MKFILLILSLLTLSLAAPTFTILPLRNLTASTVSFAVEIDDINPELYKVYFEYSADAGPIQDTWHQIFVPGFLQISEIVELYYPDTVHVYRVLVEGNDDWYSSNLQFFLTPSAPEINVDSVTNIFGSVVVTGTFDSTDSIDQVYCNLNYSFEGAEYQQLEATVQVDTATTLDVGGFIYPAAAGDYEIYLSCHYQIWGTVLFKSSTVSYTHS